MPCDHQIVMHPLSIRVTAPIAIRFDSIQCDIQYDIPPNLVMARAGSRVLHASVSFLNQIDIRMVSFIWRVQCVQCANLSTIEF